MAVVLEIQSASYSSVVNTTGDALLAGVRCGACATTTLRLTGSRVHRRLIAAVGCTQLEVAVAKCSTCGRRERVLPFDVIPGKRSGVDVTFPAVRRVVTDGKSVASVAREHGVTRRTIRQWVAGVGTRALDLERLYHHRAQPAPRDAPVAGLLVRWAAVAVELARPATTTAPRFATDLRLTASQERVEAARHLLALLDRSGGACAAAAFGASLFRQAVLMFRAPTTTRQVPPEEFAPVPGSRYRDRNSGTASTATGRPSDPIPSSQRRAQARSRTGVARRSAARAQRSVLDAAEHAALRGAEHAAPQESWLKLLAANSWDASLKERGLRHYVALARRVVTQTHRRVVLGETVPSGEKLVSIFETHTDIIVKDRRETLYGHKLCLATGASGLITDCHVEKGNPADSTLAVSMVERHMERHGRAPQQVCFDGGFSSCANLEEIKRLEVGDVVFTKAKGINVDEMTSDEKTFRSLRNFRAGIEATISFLKRCVGWTRCAWRSLRSFTAYAWASVVTANLLLIARRQPN